MLDRTPYDVSREPNDAPAYRGYRFLWDFRAALQIERLLLPCLRSVDPVGKEMKGGEGRAKQFAQQAAAGNGYAISNNICRAAWKAHKEGGWTFRPHTPQRTVILTQE